MGWRGVLTSPAHRNNLPLLLEVESHLIASSKRWKVRADRNGKDVALLSDLISDANNTVPQFELGTFRTKVNCTPIAHATSPDTLTNTERDTVVVDFLNGSSRETLNGSLITISSAQAPALEADKLRLAPELVGHLLPERAP